MDDWENWEASPLFFGLLAFLSCFWVSYCSREFESLQGLVLRMRGRVGSLETLESVR